MKEFKYDMSKHSFDKDSNTIRANELDVPPFASQYTVVSAQGGRKLFDLVETTGSEWDPNTKYIYKSKDGMVLEISQDAELTKRRAKAYLDHKMNRD